MSESTFNPSAYMMKLQGKDYLPVAPRMYWFALENPDRFEVKILDKIIDTDKGFAYYELQVTDAKGRVAIGVGSETAKDFRDFLEKSFTKAYGRALAALGYGTLAAPEFDEGNRIVDAPQGATPPTRTGSTPLSKPVAKPMSASASPPRTPAQSVAAVDQERAIDEFVRETNPANTEGGTPAPTDDGRVAEAGQVKAIETLCKVYLKKHKDAAPENTVEGILGVYHIDSLAQLPYDVAVQEIKRLSEAVNAK